MHIRRARTDDAAAIAGLGAELGYPAPAGEMQERLRRLIADPDHAVFVAEEGSVIGWLHVAAGTSLESGRRAEILGLVVTGAERGKGVGARLVAEAERWATATGLPVIRVRTNVVREDARRFYLRCGYAPSKRQEVFDKKLGDHNAGKGNLST